MGSKRGCLREQLHTCSCGWDDSSQCCRLSKGYSSVLSSHSLWCMYGNVVSWIMNFRTLNISDRSEGGHCQLLNDGQGKRNTGLKYSRGKRKAHTKNFSKTRRYYVLCSLEDCCRWLTAGSQRQLRRAGRHFEDETRQKGIVGGTNESKDKLPWPSLDGGNEILRWTRTERAQVWDHDQTPII